MKKNFTRKSVSLPDDMWAEVADYRHANRIGTEAEAHRRLVRAGLVAELSAKTNELGQRPRIKTKGQTDGD